MREAIGQSFLVTLVAILVGVIMLVLVFSIVYSKTYKIKTKIVDIMEKYKGNENVYEAAHNEINEYLTGIGYKKNANSIQDCDPVNGVSALNTLSETYRYCIYEFDSGEGLNRGKYYGVKVFIYFEFPIIGDILEIPVYGETEVFFNNRYIEG